MIIARLAVGRRTSPTTFLILEPRRTKKKDIYVISTAKRPVPLEHYLYAGKELWKIVDASRTFLNQGYTNPFLPDLSWVLRGSPCFAGTRTLARRCDESKIRNVRPRAFLRYSAWEPELQLHNVGLGGCLPAEVVHRPADEDR